ncbi:hypothetical protein DFQ27_008337 [Actinomortierella ambigua]|uniref:Tail specific protease domain-containing protein n=1 Tax=Actinomortierella ambigua TaxID=1343610 RepID=A0A9P6PTY4_9FUNG|nr:hypothetical protein DFQ27_008337 [Actinomortierella ambigua]
MQERPSRCQDQPSDRRGGKRRKHRRCITALLVAAAAILSLNTAQAAPVHDARYLPVQPIKRQDPVPSPLPGTGQGGGGGGGGQQDNAGGTDPCTALSKALEPQITYDLVRTCFENIPYNATEANSILTTLYTFYKDFYIFVDSAQQPQQKKPFTNPPVDILAELRLLGQRTYANDFEFHRQVDLVVNKLNDAHANYMPECYQHYLYIQPFDLYAPVIDGVQTIKILNDNHSLVGHPYQDCTVLTIDGEDALLHIQKWIDAHFGFSKDAGVRLNKALSQLIFNTQKMDWVYYSGQFTTRTALPEREKVVFKVRCDMKAGGGGGKAAPNLIHKRGDGRLAQEVEDEQEKQQKQQEEDEEEEEEEEEEGVETLSIPWSIYRLVSWKSFEDTPSFIQANCLVLPPEPGKTVDEEPPKQQEQQQEQDDGESDGDNGGENKDDVKEEDEKTLLEKWKDIFDKEVEEIEELVDDLFHPNNNDSDDTQPNTTVASSSSSSVTTSSINDNNKHTKRMATPQKPSRRSVSDLQGHYYAQSMARQGRATVIERRQLPAIPSPNERAARLIFNGTSSGFFQLVKRPEIGVVVIPSHMVDQKTATKHLIEGFEQLHQRGVQKVVLDLTANGGGYVNFAYDLVDWMFPNETRTSVYESDMRSSMSIKALADRDLLDDQYDGYYCPNAFSDPVTGQPLDTNFFMDDRIERRVRSPLGYTPRVLMNHDLGKFELGMPWQHHPQDMVLLTDGACGSACGMSLNRLKNRHGVASYAIGGRAKEDLSLFSFAGASVYGLDDLLNDFESLGVDAPMRRMLYRGIYRVPVMEFFQENDPVPIEYHPSLYKADFHLDYTPETARHHEKFWELIADNHWKP